MRLPVSVAATILLALALLVGVSGTAASAAAAPATLASKPPMKITKLDPALRDALQSATRAARRSGVTIRVTSGWRSHRHQQRLWREAVAKYGSKAEAARWVARPGTSRHETGDAIDVGYRDAQRWLARHGARYGLCRTYRNEPWHYELRPRALTTRKCGRMYADASHDPRTR